MFINNVSADGSHIDGLGAVFSFKLMSYALSQIYNLKFVDNQLKNILGAEFLKISNSEYDSKINAYLDLPYKNIGQSNKESFDVFFDYPQKPVLNGYQFKINTYKKNQLFKLFSRNIKKIKNEKIITSLSEGLPIESNKVYFKDGLNIVFHLRAPLPSIDIRFEPSRDYFYGSYKNIDRINNLIRQIEHSQNDTRCNFHIIALGDKENFSLIKNQNDKNEVFIHSDLNVFESFSMMVSNDLFVGTTSGLSYIAHLLNNKSVAFPLNTGFGPKSLYPDVQILNEDGFFKKLNFMTSF
tara:strand:+ start:1302 stop:2189 length:888 start_codon:yes stop_codon:yes gene_type:complete